jgi:hypothetical protein
MAEPKCKCHRDRLVHILRYVQELQGLNAENEENEELINTAFALMRVIEEKDRTISALSVTVHLLESANKQLETESAAWRNTMMVVARDGDTLN